MDTERVRARGEYEELRLEAERLRMAGNEAREALADAIGVYRPIEVIEPARVLFLSAQLVDAASKLQKEVLPQMGRIREKYGL
jgi:hypothetical protein